MAFALIFSGARVIGAPAAPAAATTPESVTKLNEAYAQLEAAGRGIDRSSFDPQAIIERVGRDEGKVFEFVRDQTYWTPYRGALRGATGVLQDRVGSSLDRALLLAELLRVSGFEVRLAHATLDDAKAAELAGKVRTIPAGWRTAGAAKQMNGEPTAADREILAQAERRGGFATGRVATQAGQLAAAMPAPAVDAAQQSARVADALKDHWWVQRKAGAAWSDLDPLLPTATPGAAIATADKTLAAPAADGRLALPAELCHELDVKVIVEKWEGGKTTEGVAVTHTLRPAEVLDRRVAFDHVPIAWPKKLADRRPEPKEFAAAVRATAEWMPVLYVGGAAIQDKSVTTAGNLVEHPKLDAAAEFGRAVGGVFGGGFGGGEAKAEAKSYFTAEWLEYTIRAPGRAPVTVRREVFDLLGPAAREKPSAGPTMNEAVTLDRGLSLLGETEILVLSCQPTPEFVTYAYLKQMLGTKTALQRGLVASGGKRRAREFVDRSAVTFNPLWYVALNRVELSPSGRDVYLDQANVFQYRSRQKAGATDADTLTTAELVDLAYNPVAVRAGAERPAFAVRVEQGVADTVAEALPLDGGKDPVANTGWLFALNNGAAPVKAAADLPAGFTADAAARVRQTLAAGNAAMITPAAVQVAGAAHVGWWRVDPKTGDTVGVMDSGFHATATERATMEERINNLIRLPFQVALEDMKYYSRKEFIDLILAGKNIQGLQLLRAFQSANKLYDLVLLL